MKRINFNLKDRKLLMLFLCLVVVSVFTLTIAYSALSAVLTIQGNAKVNSANWDIYLSNARVTSGSATTDVPIVNGVTATFATTLNMPGDFYEFVVDVVNGGSIDAMIENVVKTPDLTVEQAKFLKYEITYQNGESISSKQLLAKGTTMPIKVRIEYRKDVSDADLPTGQLVLDLSLMLEYIQSDGSGSFVKDNGAMLIYADGDINDIGTVVTIGSEQFYTIGTDDDNVKLFSKYNLFVGAYVFGVSTTKNYADEETTGKQDSRMKGQVSEYPYHGVVPFSDFYIHGEQYSSYVGSYVEVFVNDYKDILENEYDITISEARLITYEELTDSNTFKCSYMSRCSTDYPFIAETSYWTGSASSNEVIYHVFNNGLLWDGPYNNNTTSGVRPVIVISKDYF